MIKESILNKEISVKHLTTVIICLLTVNLCAQSIPSSRRSKLAIAKVQPRLIKELQQKGLHYAIVIIYPVPATANKVLQIHHRNFQPRNEPPIETFLLNRLIFEDV